MYLNGGWQLTIKSKLTWQSELNRYKKSPFENSVDTRMEYHLIRATEQMQEKYPGNYVVEEYYNGENFAFDLRLKFDTPDDEIMFLLKYEE